MNPIASKIKELRLALNQVDTKQIKMEEGSFIVIVLSSYNNVLSSSNFPYSTIQNPYHFPVIFVPPFAVYFCHILSVIAHFFINDTNKSDINPKIFNTL